MSENKKHNAEDNLSDLVTQYCIDHPKIPTQTLARWIIFDNPDILSPSDLENIRGRIRIRRQKKKGQGSTYKTLNLQGQSIEEAMKFFRLEEEKSAIPDFIMNGDQSVLVFSDVHIPYHVKSAVEACLKAGQERNIDTIIINGDLLDFYKVSRFTKDPRRRNVRYEIDMGKEFLEFLRSVFPKARIVYKCGNHDERFELWIKSNVPELYMEEFMLPAILNLDDLGVEWVESKQKIKLGKLNVVHGHEFGKSVFNPVNAARGLFLRSHANSIIGHFHATSVHHENNLDGDQIGCWSMGCLCELSPEYAPFAYTKWNHGFALVSVEENGNFEVTNKRILS